MKKVVISEKIKTQVPQTQIGYIEAEVKYEKFNSALWQQINDISEFIRKNYNFETIKQIPQIQYSRQAYKKLGKDPSRYRLSAESLFRRIIKNNQLYQISNLVDTINLASLKTGFSIGGYDFNKIDGNTITFDLGTKEDVYYGIGRGLLNIENMPVFRDNLGAFGSPTSDSERTKIDQNTSKILLLVINFGTDRPFISDLKLIEQLLTKFCSAQNTVIEIF